MKITIFIVALFTHQMVMAQPILKDAIERTPSAEQNDSKLQEIPLFVDSDFEYQPVRANFPEQHQSKERYTLINVNEPEPISEPEPAPEERSIGEVATDTGTQLGEGVNTTTTSILNSECNPRGVVNKVKAMASPRSFWKKAITEIDATVAAEYARIRLNRIEEARDRANAAFDDQAMRAMGMPVYSDPAMDKEIAETEAFIRNLDAESLRETKEWAAKCRPYATKKLSEPW